MQKTIARFFLQDCFLLANGVYKNFLAARAGRQFFGKRSVMHISAAKKFLNQCFMAQIQRSALPHPAQSFRMPRISAPAFVFSQNIPKAVQFAVLRQQMFSAQMFRMYIPDSHPINLPQLIYLDVYVHLLFLFYSLEL